MIPMLDIIAHVLNLFADELTVCASGKRHHIRNDDFEAANNILRGWRDKK